MVAYYVAAAWIALQLPMGIAAGKWIKNGALA
jgi:hypothetical protein